MTAAATRANISRKSMCFSVFIVTHRRDPYTDRWASCQRKPEALTVSFSSETGRFRGCGSIGRRIGLTSGHTCLDDDLMSATRSLAPSS